MNNSRVKSLALSLTLCFLVVLFRLFYWQVVKSNQLGKLASMQSYKLDILSPKRGQILSSDGFPLATNQTKYLLSIYKPDLKKPVSEVINDISLVYPDFPIKNSSQIRNLINNPNQKWATFTTTFSSDQISELKVPGVSFSEISLRVNPEISLAHEVLGLAVNQNGQLQGFGGIEGYYNKQLSGKNGFTWESKDATGKTILSSHREYHSAVDGRTLKSTLNRSVQFYVEQILDLGVSRYSADSGSIIVMQPQTGSILALYSTQSASLKTNDIRNPAISDLFEPGSIFKPLVVAMALDSHSIDTNHICFDCNRPRVIGQYTINNWDNATHPDSTLQDIIKNSDNIGMSGIIAKMGLKRFLDYYHLLNLDQKTNIDLQGESKPPKKEVWPEIDLATASFGQGFAVTQIGMLESFNALANNGILVHPKLINYYIENSKSFPTKDFPTTTVFQPRTAIEVNKILKYAVENGIVQKFKPADLEVCGKSGTAQIAIKGNYNDSSTIASYIGFSPCKNPKFTMIVTINNPRTSPWGSSTAAPVWFDLAQIFSTLL
jgi:cell division protein FtsI/penicillin-binding protein 2